MIELETSLTIGPLVQAIGIEEPKPSSFIPDIGINLAFPINIGQSTSSTIKVTSTSLTPDTATTFTSTEGTTSSTISDSDTNDLGGPNLERCWMAAWSDDILRTSFADLEDTYNFFGLSGSGFKGKVYKNFTS